tara:strand:- start:496 stop:1188 length:693 start_codon:yes stop_codon:yes gene_type:complete
MRSFIFVLAFLITKLISAQTEKGAVVLEGNTSISFGSLKVNSLHNIFAYESGLPNNSLKNTSFSFNAGYFIIDKLSINLSINHNYDIVNYNSSIYCDGEDSYLSYGIFGRYYINNLWLWVQAGYKIGQLSDYSFLENANYAWSANSIAPLATEQNGSTTVPINTFLLDFGFSFFISPSISIDPTIGATKTTWLMQNIAFINEAGEATDSFDLGIKSVQFKLTVGLILHLQ